MKLMPKLIFHSYLLVVVTLVAGCDSLRNKLNETPRVRVVVPSNSQQYAVKQGLFAQATPWDEMCYFVNVTGGETQAKQSNLCEVATGITTGEMKSPGSEISLELSQSTKPYQMQMIGYLRSSSTVACPQLTALKGLSSLDPSRLYEVGVTSFTVDQSEVTVSLPVRMPTTTLKDQYNLASGCVQGPPSISVSAGSVTEGTGSSVTPMTFTVTLSREAEAVVSVQYSTGGGSATSGTDYSSAAGVLEFAVGEKSKIITVNVAQDSTSESTETFLLTLSGGDGYIASDSTLVATGTIVDDDSSGTPTVPTVSFSSSSQTVIESTGAISILVSLSSASASQVVVPFTLGGTLTAGSDYAISHASSITIPAGSLSGTITITLTDDAAIEPTETLILTMGSVSGATASAPTAHTLSVTDNDSMTPFSINGVAGGTDVNYDAFLNFNTYPTFSWAASTGADSYDLQIYESDGVTTVSCGAATGVTTTTKNFASCALTQGNTYKLKVFAKTSTGASLAATNTPFTFKVNRSPVAVNDGPYYVMAGSGNTLSLAVLADNLATGTNDPDSDPDGDLLTITSSSPGTLGTTSISGNNIVYTVTGTNRGVDTFNYVISDGSLTSTATVTVHIVDAYTWTGNGLDNYWSNTSNWCGAINANKTGCTGGSVPVTSNAVTVDGTCGGGAKCNIILDSSISVQKLTLDTGFANSFSQGIYTMTIGSGGFLQKAGTFTGGSSAVVVNGVTQVDAGYFTSTSGTWSTQQWQFYSYPNFDANLGTLAVGGGSSQSQFVAGYETYHNLEFNNNNGHGFDLFNSMVEVEGSLTFNASGEYFQNGLITVYGPLSFYGISGSTNFNVNSEPTSNISIYASASAIIPSLGVGSSGGTTTMSGNFQIGENITFNSGTINTTSLTLTILKNLGTATIYSAGNRNIGNLVIAPTTGGAVSLNAPSGVEVNNLTINYSGGSQFIMSSVYGHYSVVGSYVMNCTGNCQPGSSNIFLTGPTAQIWNQQAGNSPVFSVIVAKAVNDTVEFSGGAADFYFNGSRTVSGTTFSQNIGVTQGILNMNGKTLHMVNATDGAEMNGVYIGSAGTINMNGGGIVGEYLAIDAGGVLNYGSSSAVVTLDEILNDGTVNKNGSVNFTATTVGGSGSYNP